MYESLNGKVALVTGGGSGIGRATSQAFARLGCKVVVSDMNGPGGLETVKGILESGGEAVFIPANVTVTTQVQALVERTVSRFGRLDCAVNNAGINITSRLPTHLLPEDDWDRIIDVNLRGVWLSMKYEIPVMLDQGRGAIVNLASIYGLVGAPNTAAYTASKHGVSGLTKVAALDYAKSGIRVNAVGPGYTDTSMVQRVVDANPGIQDWMISKTPAGRMGNPGEIAQAIVWLCSDEASFVTGAIVPANAYSSFPCLTRESIPSPQPPHPVPVKNRLV
jgi:NAD(P)-dependent dehydrogenase (short-subunit alcohol dehydrogenase family)